MRFTKVRIKNFRALTDIEVDFVPGCNVVVGPNAAGKTTVLEAIRLAKGVLAPRTQGEPNQVLFALGAMSPHSPGFFDASALTNDLESQIEIRCGVEFDEDELALLELPQSLALMATQLMLSNMGRSFAPSTELVGLFSTPQGRAMIEGNSQVLQGRVAEIKRGDRKPELAIVITPKTSQVESPDPEGAVMIGFLDRRLPPVKTVFSYFPADRAIPAQEQPVQIGPGDANIQLESHNSQPQLKYSRLKNTIFNAVVAGRGAEQSEQFASIFTKILRGRALAGVKVSDQAKLQIEVRDEEKDRTFSIDAMSSGEKGLILTCLLIAQTMEKGGIVLLDEPELHLNPAVCKDVLNFLADEYARPQKLQMIICTHSPEILGVAFERDDCELYHLVAGNELAPVRKQDLEEVGAAFKKLGSSQNEGLLYRGTVFVEGQDDSEILREGFKSVFQRYIFRELGGRKNVEKEVQLLQAQEKQGRNPFRTAFILDNDGDPTTLRSSNNVRVLQWDRRCVENYLLDFDVLTDLAMDSNLSKNLITNITALKRELKDLAMGQVNEIAFWARYNELFADPPLKPREIRGKSYLELANLAFERAAATKARIPGEPRESWKSDFARACEEKEVEVKRAWEEGWPILCDGKRLIRDFHEKVGFRENLFRLKIRIIKGMEAGRTALWQEAERKLAPLAQAPIKLDSPVADPGR
jgi:predicted ATPase